MELDNMISMQSFGKYLLKVQVFIFILKLYQCTPLSWWWIWLPVYLYILVWLVIIVILLWVAFSSDLKIPGEE
jgi:hypothetical protein